MEEIKIPNYIVEQPKHCSNATLKYLIKVYSKINIDKAGFFIYCQIGSNC